MALSNIQKLEKLVSQINRRLSDTTRAYEQEKKVCDAHTTEGTIGLFIYVFILIIRSGHVWI